MLIGDYLRESLYTLGGSIVAGITVQNNTFSGINIFADPFTGES